MATVTLAGGVPLLAAEATDSEKTDTQIVSVRSQLLRLDQLAEACLQSPASNTADDTPCEQFRLALNGPELTAYLDSCRSLKAWRDQLVTDAVNDSDQTAVQDTETTLRKIMNVEYYCGENALLQRTNFIDTAYNNRLARNRSLTRDVGSLERQFDELRQNSLINSERQRLLEDVQEMQQRQQRTVQQSQERQELELLRQQQQRQNPQ